MKKIIFLTIIATFIVTLVVTYGGYKAVKVTGEYPFCGSCHAWDGEIAKTNLKDNVHGSANPKGVQASCTDCHLPHDSFVNYMITKAKNGISEGYTTLTGDPSKKDWLGNREHARANYTFDSSCLKCHQNLFETKEGEKKNINKMHAQYLSLKDSQDALKCTSCHKHVGHKDLGETLYKIQNKQPSSWEEWEKMRKEATK